MPNYSILLTAASDGDGLWIAAAADRLCYAYYKGVQICSSSTMI